MRRLFSCHVIPNLSQLGAFPPVDEALTEPDGLLCLGGDLSTNTLLSAYQQGIFPWYNVGEPILWWSPSERMVLYPDEVHISRSMSKSLKKHHIECFWNRNFDHVITRCAHIKRNDQGTWIHPEMVTAYQKLFDKGHAFCLEVQVDGKEAGGLYGVATDHVLCGESMYSTLPNGSKYALMFVCQWLKDNGLKLLDCQLHNPHLESMGARLIPRQKFIQTLNP